MKSAYNGEIWSITLLQKILFLHISWVDVSCIYDDLKSIRHDSFVACSILSLGFQWFSASIWNLSKQKHLALSLSSSHPRPLRSAALSSKMKTYKRLKTKIVKFQDPKRSFELFKFLIYSVSIPYHIWQRNLFFFCRVHGSCSLGDRFAFQSPVRCMSVCRSAIQI